MASESDRDHIPEVALGFDPPQQTSFLNELRQTNPGLEVEVQQLLHLNQNLETRFLGQPAGNLLFHHFQPGQTLDRYTIHELIGTGGMARVYRGRDTTIGRDVALKVLLAFDADEQQLKDRFFRELRILGSINHENIVRLYDCGQVGDVLYLVMELLHGEDLSRVIAAGRCGSFSQRLDIARQIATALQHVHAAGIVHRDLKPANVFLEPSGRVKLMDFGIARNNSGATAHTVFAGTPHYMAPEQLNQGTTGFATDIYAFGILFFELLTGQRVFSGPTPAAILRQILDEDLPMQPLRDAKIPENIVHLIRACTEKNPADRPADFSVILSVLNGGEYRHRTIRGHLRAVSRSRWLWLSGVAVLLVCTAVLMFLRLYSYTVTGRVAVLPIISAEGVTQDQPLREGLTENLTQSIAATSAQHPNLHVLSETEVASHHVTTPQQARRLLGVDTVLTGSFKEDSSQSQVTLNLVRTADQKTLAQTTVRSDRGDLSVLEREAVAAADQLLGIQPANEGRRSGQSRAPLAYESYLQGVGYLKRYDRKANLDLAITAFEAALHRDPSFALGYAGLAEALRLKAKFANDNKALQAAFDNCKHALELDPNCVPALVTLAQLHSASAQYDLALQEFEHSLKLEPLNSDALSGKARTLEQLGRVTEAEALFKQTKDLSPTDAENSNRLGGFYYRHGRYKEAAAQFSDLIKLQPDNADAYSNLGAAERRLGHLDQALQLYQKSVAIRPSAPVLTNLGTLYYSQGQYVKAAEFFKQAVTLNENDYLLWGNLAAAYRHTPGQSSLATAAFEKAAKLARDLQTSRPTDAEIRGDLADFEAALGHRDRAVAAIRSATLLAPTNSSIWLQAADTYATLGLKSNALDTLRQAIKLGATWEEIKQHQDLRTLATTARLFPQSN